MSVLNSNEFIDFLRMQETFNNPKKVSGKVKRRQKMARKEKK